MYVCIGKGWIGTSSIDLHTYTLATEPPSYSTYACYAKLNSDACRFAEKKGGIISKKTWDYVRHREYRRDKMQKANTIHIPCPFYSSWVS